MFIIKDLISYLIPLIAVFFSYFLGLIQSKKTDKRISQTERYENFYEPFINTLYRGFMWEIKFSELSSESIHVFLDLVIKNIKYLDMKTTKLIPMFYKACLDLFEYNDNNKDYNFAPNVADKEFNKLCLSVIAETAKISKDLNLPDTSNEFKNLFCKPIEEN